MPGRRVLVFGLGAVLLGGGISACRGCAKEPTAEVDAGASEDVDVRPLYERARVPGLAWASFSAREAKAGAAGWADVEAKLPATDTTPFEAASIAKMVVAVTVMQLVEEGLVDLDADAARWLGFPLRDDGTTITPRQLLTHTSTIRDLPETAARGALPLGDFLVRYFDAGPARGVFLDASPGSYASYSNVGPSLAALVVERVRGVRFAEVAAERVFDPLGMSATFFATDGRAPPRIVAVPYATDGARFVRLTPPSHALYPVVDLFTSARDLSRFGRMLLRDGELDGRRLLYASSVEEMLRAPFDAAPDDALGFQVRTFGGAHVLGHEGEDEGASTALYVDRSAGRGALFLANGDAFQSNDRSRSGALAELVSELLRER